MQMINKIRQILPMFVLDTSFGLGSDNNTVYYTSLSGNSIRSRSYSVSINDTSCKLASTVDDLYNIDAKGWNSRGVIRSCMEEVKELVAHNKYVLSPTLYYVLNNDYPIWTKPVLNVEHYELVALLRASYRLGHLHLIDDSKYKTLLVSKAGCPSDLLVYMALAARLLTLIGSSQNVRTLEDLETDHYNQMHNMANIRRIYKIDITISKVDKMKVLNKIMNIKGLTRIEKRLISSFVNLPMTHTLNSETNTNSHYLNHIPVIGELTQVLFHIFLIDEFDAKFRKHYPRNPFYRLGTEVIIPIPDDYYVDLDIDPSKVLDEFHLFGTLFDIESDERPYMPCTPHERIVITLFDGKISVCGASEWS